MSPAPDDGARCGGSRLRKTAPAPADAPVADACGRHHPAMAAAVQQADRWLAAIGAALGASERDAYLALRAVLHALRDRLAPRDAIRLGARLPTLLRGVFFERFAGDGEARPPAAFADVAALVKQRLAPIAGERIDASAACRATLALLEQAACAGDLPADTRALLPRPDEPAAPSAGSRGGAAADGAR